MTNNPFLWHFIKPVSKTLSATNGGESDVTKNTAEGNRQTFIELSV